MPAPAVIHCTSPAPMTPAVPGRVLVLELALEHVGDRLEAAVRMVGRADRLARPVVDRPHLVEEQERIDQLEPGGRERAAHDEAAALGLLVRGDDSNRRIGS